MNETCEIEAESEMDSALREGQTRAKMARMQGFFSPR